MGSIRRFLLFVLLALIPITNIAQEIGKERNIFFESNSSTLSAEAKKKLDSLIYTKKINSSQYLLIYGYSDNTGDRKQCDEISKKRANRVKNYLILKGLNDYNFLLCAGLGQIDSLPKYMNEYDSLQYSNKVEIITENIKNINVSISQLNKCKISEVTQLPENIPNADDRTIVRHNTFDEKTISVKLKNGDQFFGALSVKLKKMDYGVYLWANGEKYAGEFSNDKKEGHGIYKWKNGTIFEGEWKNDVPVSGKITENLTNKFLLKILTDIDCGASINGTDNGVITSGVISRFLLPKGKFKIKLTGIEDTNKVFVTHYTVKSFGEEDFISVNLDTPSEKQHLLAQIADTIHDSSATEISQPGIDITPIKTDTINAIRPVNDPLKNYTPVGTTSSIIDSLKNDSLTTHITFAQVPPIPDTVLKKPSKHKKKTKPVITVETAAKTEPEPGTVATVVKPKEIVSVVTIEKIKPAEVTSNWDTLKPIIDTTIKPVAIITPPDIIKPIADTVIKPVTTIQDTVKPKAVKIIKTAREDKKKPSIRILSETATPINSELSKDTALLSTRSVTIDSIKQPITDTSIKPVAAIIALDTIKPKAKKTIKATTQQKKKPTVKIVSETATTVSSEPAHDTSIIAIIAVKDTSVNPAATIITPDTIKPKEKNTLKSVAKHQKKPSVKIVSETATAVNPVPTNDTSAVSIKSKVTDTFFRANIDTTVNKPISPKINTDTVKPQVTKAENASKHKKKHKAASLQETPAPVIAQTHDTSIVVVQIPEITTVPEAPIEIIPVPDTVPKTGTDNIIQPKPIAKKPKKKPVKPKKVPAVSSILQNQGSAQDNQQTESYEDKNARSSNEYITMSPFQNYDTSNNMIYIEGGTYNMGSNYGGFETKPLHKITISSFFLCRYDVTVAEFRKFIKATGYRTKAEQDGSSFVISNKNDTSGDKFLKRRSNVTWEYDENGIKRDSSQENLPVLHISWDDANQYCEWLSKVSGKKYRLPTEAEWEYVAKGGIKNAGKIDTAVSAGTATEPDTGFYKNPVNMLGVENLSGETWEWCSDWYEVNYYEHSPVNNPQGQSIGNMKVLRGGSWAKCTGYNRYTCRYFNYPEYCGGYITFRLAKTE